MRGLKHDGSKAKHDRYFGFFGTITSLLPLAFDISNISENKDVRRRNLQVLDEDGDFDN
jgi:hypothetical protein